MIPEFASLNEQEQEALYDAIPLITVLIAGADGEIDEEEKSWAEKVTEIRSYTFHDSLQAYYQNVGERYNKRLDIFMEKYSGDPASNGPLISEQLAQLNPILAKLDINFGEKLYDSFVSFAKHVAKASGGFLGFMSISKEEEKWVDLPMIHPIVVEE